MNLDYARHGAGIACLNAVLALSACSGDDRRSSMPVEWTAIDSTNTQLVMVERHRQEIFRWDPRGGGSVTQLKFQPESAIVYDGSASMILVTGRDDDNSAPAPGIVALVSGNDPLRKAHLAEVYQQLGVAPSRKYALLYGAAVDDPERFTGLGSIGIVDLESSECGWESAGPDAGAPLLNPSQSCVGELPVRSFGEPILELAFEPVDATIGPSTLCGVTALRYASHVALVHVASMDDKRHATSWRFVPPAVASSFTPAQVLVGKTSQGFVVYIRGTGRELYVVRISSPCDPTAAPNITLDGFDAHGPVTDMAVTHMPSRGLLALSEDTGDAGVGDAAETLLEFFNSSNMVLTQSPIRGRFTKLHVLRGAQEDHVVLYSDRPDSHALAYGSLAKLSPGVPLWTELLHVDGDIETMSSLAEIEPCATCTNSRKSRSSPLLLVGYRGGGGAVIEPESGDVRVLPANLPVGGARLDQSGCLWSLENGERQSNVVLLDLVTGATKRVALAAGVRDWVLIGSATDPPSCSATFIHPGTLGVSWVSCDLARAGSPACRIEVSAEPVRRWLSEDPP